MSDPFEDGEAPRREWTAVDRRRILLAAVVTVALLAVLWFEGRSGGKDDEDASPVGDWPVSDEARDDVPADLLLVYQQAATNCPGLPWPVVAAIGKVETNHNREPGTSEAGALGPMQFLPATWQEYQADGDGDGVADVNDEEDAIHGAVRLLCANGGDAPRTLPAAIHSYNRSAAYVDEVLTVADGYTSGEIRTG